MSQSSATTPLDSSEHLEDSSAINEPLIAIDMHADTVQRLVDEGVNLNQRLPDGHLDAVRMREGRLDAQFFAVWVEPQFYGTGGREAIERADRQIAALHALAEQCPETWEIATTAGDIRRIKREGKLAALIGLEGGYAIDEKLENVERYFHLGVRYMSPTWIVSTSWAGSSGDELGRTRGLNDFGKEVIRLMNRLGMMIDVSHVSDKTFWDIINTSTQPVIATHSGARFIVPVARNLDDEQLKALARTGGVCSIVFYPAFLEPGWREQKNGVEAEIAPLVEEVARRTEGSLSQKRMACDRVREREFARRLPTVPVARVVDHIDHIVGLAGLDHVGIGSDFDGIQATPQGLSSVAELPNLSVELKRRGYSETDVAKIFGGNILRMMKEVERGDT